MNRTAIILITASLLFSAGCGRQETLTGNYASELMNAVWEVTMGTDKYEYRFYTGKFNYALGKLGGTYMLSGLDATNRVFCIVSDGRHVPVHWEPVDSTTVKITSIDGAKYYLSPYEALNAELSPGQEWLIMKKK